MRTPKKIPKGRRVPVTIRALTQRVNRAAKRAYDEGEDRRWLRLRASRGAALIREFGPYHVIDLAHNCILSLRVDPEEWARERGALADFEYLVEKEG